MNKDSVEILLRNLKIIKESSCGICVYSEICSGPESEMFKLCIRHDPCPQIIAQKCIDLIREEK